MVQVTMLRNTTFQGKKLVAGATVEVEALTAERWKKFGIAKEKEPENKPLDKMKTAELEALAAELGVDISEAKNNPERVALLELVIQKVTSDGDE